jgi:threonine/homoserine/homoserine lactone efflux protein
MLFTILKLVGALYLVWLGVKLWRSKPVFDNPQDISKPQSAKSMFWNAYLVTALNPKGIFFFIAFVPQFVNAGQATLPQFIILEITFLVLAAGNVAIWAMLAGSLRTCFKKPETLTIINRIGASFLICAGLITATLRRTN